jgi:[CysO sulfur-carrier protein]-thiocarboxylate-dependent cysteine synthase
MVLARAGAGHVSTAHSTPPRAGDAPPAETQPPAGNASRAGSRAQAGGAPQSGVERLRPHAHEGAGPHGGRFPSIVDAIGHTPLVEIPRMSPNENVRLYAKLEFMNPTGSVKDRVAKYLMEDLERRGVLRPDSIIIEPTSGNTGIALAMIARRKGYRVAVVMPDNVTNERRQLLALFGAEIIDSPGAKGSNGAVELAKYLVSRDERFVMPYQYGNPANPLAHYEGTAEEIIADCPEVDVFIAGLGTGGTLTGVGRRLREHNPEVRIVAAEPMPGENVQGLRSLEEGFVPEVFDPSTLDAKFLVSSADAIQALRALTEREGIFAGVSSGAALVAASRVAAEMEHGTIVVLLADGGWKYLSGGIWTRDLGEMERDLESRSWW